MLALLQALGQGKGNVLFCVLECDFGLPAVDDNAKLHNVVEFVVAYNAAQLCADKAHSNVRTRENEPREAAEKLSSAHIGQRGVGGGNFDILAHIFSSVSYFTFFYFTKHS